MYDRRLGLSPYLRFFIYASASAREGVNLDKGENISQRKHRVRALDNPSFVFSTEGGMLCIKPTEPGYPI